MKKFFILSLTIFSTLVCSTVVHALTFNDTSGTSYQTAVDELANKGIIQGYGDGRYGPFININRAEFTKILIESRYPGKASGEDCFPDIHKEWFAKYICFAQQKNIINGYPEGFFGPEKNINLAEALKISLETYNFNVPASSYAQWYEKYYWFAQPKGLLNGIELNIGKNINRGEVAQLIYNILHYASPVTALTKPVLTSPTNNTPISPASGDIYFTWNAVPNATSYDLILTKDSGTPQTFSVGNKTDYDITFPNLNAITGQNIYSWKIRANDANNSFSISDPWYFTINIGNVVNNLQKPSLVIPPKDFNFYGGNYGIDYDGTPATQYADREHFQWYSVAGATHYDLMLRFGNNANYKVYSTSGPNVYYFVPNTDYPPLTQDYEHHWKVRAYDGSGNYIDSEEWSFKVFKDLKSTCTATPSTQEVNKAVTFTINPGEGKGPYFYNWPEYYLNLGTEHTKNQVVVSYDYPGQQSFSIDLNDSTSDRIHVICNATIIQPQNMGPASVESLPENTNNLTELYNQKPSQNNITQIMSDFKITWVDNNQTGQVWPSDFLFDQASLKPSKMVIISKLNALKHQAFSEPLPFTTLSIYDFVKKYSNKMNIALNANPNSDGSGIMNLNCSFGFWKGVESGSCNPVSLSYYIDALQLFVHEARHSSPSDPGHRSCGINAGNDQYLENGSGYAYAAMYNMWVYKYGIFDTQEMKERAKVTAMDILKTRFCVKPSHSNPKVQAIINELLS